MKQISIIENFRVRKVDLKDGQVEVSVIAATENRAISIAKRDVEHRFGIDKERLIVSGVEGGGLVKRVTIKTGESL